MARYSVATSVLGENSPGKEILMKKDNLSIKEELAPLLEKSFVEEASQKVWSSFEKALLQMDDESLGLLRQHFSGMTVQQISAERNLKSQEVDAWLKKAKRQVMENLRRVCDVRQ